MSNLARKIILLTNSQDKIPEVLRQTSRYGIAVQSGPKTKEVYSESDITEFLDSSVFAVLIENTSLHIIHSDHDRQTGNLVERVGMEITLENIDQYVFQKVVHISHLSAWMVRKSGIQPFVTEARTYGLINNQKSLDSHVFGWDDRFLVEGLGKTYQELKQNGIKISSRDQVISKMIIAHCYYLRKIDLHYHPLQLATPISFETEEFEKIYYGLIKELPAMTAYGLHKITVKALDQGLGLSSPLNRRLKLSWNPNLTLFPLTQKKDDRFHELTYGEHDLSHLAFRPDLVYTGETDPFSRQLYLLCRIASEAISLVYADMFFVKAVFDSGSSYPSYQKRKIYPVFLKILEAQEITLAPTDPAVHEKVFDLYRHISYANTRYCLLGDRSAYLQLLQGSCAEFDAFDQKYSQFMIQDYRWTDANYEQMLKEAHLYRIWWQKIAPLNDRFSLGFITITHFRSHFQRRSELSYNRLVDLVYEYIYRDCIRPVFEFSKDYVPNNLTKAFLRYLCNQSYALIKFSMADTNQIYSTALFSYFQECTEVTLEDVSRFRHLFTHFFEN